MDKAQAIDLFWNSFDLIAYDENTVPDEAVMPYITYSMSSGAMDDILLMSASLWYKSMSWAEITKKSDLIAEDIGYGGTVKSIDGGYIYITRGTPFAQRMGDPSDQSIRRMLINITVEFLTAT